MEATRLRMLHVQGNISNRKTSHDEQAKKIYCHYICESGGLWNIPEDKQSRLVHKWTITDNSNNVLAGVIGV